MVPARPFTARSRKNWSSFLSRPGFIDMCQEKAVFETPEGDAEIKTASCPTHPLGKGLASVDLLAWS